MHRHHGGWSERLEMENGSFWRHEDSQRRGMLGRSGAGTLGQGTDSALALTKTMSMPILGPQAPCGRRVGSDMGDIQAMDELEVFPLRRPVRLQGDLEDRLQFLECSFSGSQGQFLYPQSLSVPSTGGRATGRLTAGSRGSLTSSRMGSALQTPLLTGRSGTPAFRR
ncbi:unnamed protein product [Polarella glacialis]|uniref:Uncharacterized protein n=1 Tax=Polarella glacialis TaxID=89957 RepID=A0A813K466_POLGL|nr:unnamed protein product [Polarella glacialis]